MLLAQKKHGLSRSPWPRGFTTKLHAVVDALGFVLTPGQQAERLVSPYTVDAVIADKGYNSDAFVAFVKACEAEAVIPSRRNRKA